MKIKLRYFFCFLFAVTTLASTLVAQDFKTDYKKVQDTYLHLENFYCELKINMYKKSSAPAPLQQLTAVIKKQGENTCYTMGKITMLVNEKCMLYLDEQEKRMVYTIRDTKKIVPDLNQYTAIVDSLLDRNDSVIFNGSKNDEKKYTLYTSKQEIMRAEVYIDQRLNTLSKLVYYYKSRKNTEFEKVSIDYDHITMAAVFKPADFSESKYVLVTGKKLTPAAGFAGYQIEVIDQRNLKN
jgi:hypothetical protein